MKEKILFELKEIEAQLNAEQLEEVKGIIYYAKSSGIPQEFSIGSGQRIGVFPSGKMAKIKRNQE